MATLRCWTAAMAVLLALAALNGCNPAAERVSKDNYERLKAGMSFEEAVEFLGQPQTSETWFGLRQYTWVENERHIHVKFLANRAIYFSSKGLEPAATPRKSPWR